MAIEVASSRRPAPASDHVPPGRGRDLDILLFNLAMDARHPTLGHSIVWARELARRCRHVSVITMTAGDYTVPDNVTVRSLGLERGRSEPRRLVEFYRSVHEVLRERQIDACFAHMAPLFAAMFAPVARLRGIPVLLWYAHKSVTWRLRVAHALADRCVTPSLESFRLPSAKLHTLGHGVDTDVFLPPAAPGPGYERTAVCIGRLSPTKRVHELIEAVAVLRARHGLELRLELVGGPLTPADEHYAAELPRQAARLDVADLVELRGPVPFHEVPAFYHRGGLFLSASDNGSMDKAVLESMASGCIPVSRNAAFSEMARAHGLGRLVSAEGAAGLAEAIAAVLAESASERHVLRGRVRQIVEDEHHLGALADTIVAHLAELAEGGG